MFKTTLINSLVWATSGTPHHRRALWDVISLERVVIIKPLSIITQLLIFIFINYLKTYISHASVWSQNMKSNFRKGFRPT
ncbi:hypothetical protein HanRHA438_Chr07g0294491 [Helianthus annuus]|nr:hypothetical protein HanHA300_Chr07g0233401 [Helianthus annuus]KAJ0562369.1 hypothetical protein HanHA89_Chr07g0250561 [Helianthus annuus]KAJ0727745.1 hypothetical protein HanLR1_Chr07g0233341 [Helianthus annuus]KAJ0907066.1 hypothetical protein HanRHA438_Chr07g0294491 [Helianthus annuus]